MGNPNTSVLALRKELIEIISEFPENERTVICARFGLWSGQSQTLDQVGKDMGVTRDRIRQLEAKALRKLRLPAHQTLLKRHFESMNT